MTPLADPETPVLFCVRIRTLLYCAAACLFSALLSILLWRLDPGVISGTYNKGRQLFEIFGCLASFSLFTILFLEMKRLRGAALRDRLPALVFFLTLFFFIIVLVEYNAKSVDYFCFERAAGAAMAGNNIYDGTKYEYPPALAHGMAFVLRILSALALRLDPGQGPGETLHILFFLFNGLQIVRLMAVFFLMYSLSRKLRFSAAQGALLTGALCAVNAPMFRTFIFNQTDLAILAVFLFALVLPSSYDPLRGLAVAAGAHLKLFPLILFLPWLFMKKMRPILWTLAGLALLFLLQVLVFSNLEAWKQWLAFFVRDYPDYTHLRNNCLFSFWFNTFNVWRFHLPLPGAVTPSGAAHVLAPLSAAAILVFFLRRFHLREKAARVPAADAENGFFRACGHTGDAVALMLLISPSAWEHHFVLALPLILFAFATGFRLHPARIACAAFLILVPPTFDIYPLSYHRAAGLLLLIASLPPARFTPEGELT